MPFTKLEKRLARGDPGINRVDKSCKKHDIAYSKNKETKKRHIADEEFLNDLDAIENPTNGFYPLGERQARVLIKPIIKAKKTFGMGYKMKCIKCKKETNFKNIEENTSKNNRRYIVGLSQKEIIDFLQSQDVYTKFKPVIRNFRRQTYASHIDDQWQADLIDMQRYSSYNDNTNYMVTIIDIFSKFAWAIPIKRKTGKEVSEAFRKVFKQRKPEKIQTDKGTKFINKDTQRLFRDNNIHWFTTENVETKAAIVERFNKTLKEKMWKYFEKNDTKKWINVLPKLIENYNNSKHRSIKMTPIEGKKSKMQNQPPESQFQQLFSNSRIRILVILIWPQPGLV
ncbi:putative uncharacterized transposon-derived protein F54H12.3 [Trichonephila clavipes]|nr:putative uncharacterized transposon-derived protein F54H12.3 [Trichonephila clavipes]